jgi:hypothetical protein
MFPDLLTPASKENKGTNLLDIIQSNFCAHSNYIYPNTSTKFLSQKDTNRQGNKAWDCEIISRRSETNNSLLTDGALSSRPHTFIIWGKNLNFTVIGNA